MREGLVVPDWNKKIIEEFRANQGRVGGSFEGAPLLLLHTTGRRTGAERVNPVMYLREGDRVYVFGSKGGAPNHPDWYHNLLADPNVTVELGTQTYPARAEVITGAEPDRIYAKPSRRHPGFAEYQRSTRRVIPVIALIGADA